MFKHQKVLLTIGLILTLAMTIYTGAHSLTVQDKQMAGTGQTAAQTAKETKESETKKVKETRSTKSTKETEAETKRSEKEPETKKAAETKKDTASKNGSSAVSGTASGAKSNSSGNGSTQSQASGNSSSSGNSGSHSSPSTPNAPAPSAPSPTVTETTHTHNWVQKTHTVHHEAIGHYEDVVVSEAWDEPVYTTVWKDICNGCGADITADPWGHIEEQMVAGNLACGGYSTMPFYEITGYAHHDAVTESRWVEDTAAYDEMVIDGYVCSGCGAVK